MLFMALSRMRTNSSICSPVILSSWGISHRVYGGCSCSGTTRLGNKGFVPPARALAVGMADLARRCQNSSGLRPLLQDILRLLQGRWAEYVNLHTGQELLERRRVAIRNVLGPFAHGHEVLDRRWVGEVRVAEEFQLRQPGVARSGCRDRSVFRRRTSLTTASANSFIWRSDRTNAGFDRPPLAAPVAWPASVSAWGSSVQG